MRVGKIVQLGSNIKTPTEFDNTIRHILSGNAKDGWIHAKFEVEVKEYHDGVGLIFKFKSIQDGSLLKTMERKNLTDGDTMKLKGST